MTELTLYLAVSRARAEMRRGAEDGLTVCVDAAAAFGVDYRLALKYATQAHEGCHAARQARDVAEQQRRDAELGFEAPGGRSRI